MTTPDLTPERLAELRLTAEAAKDVAPGDWWAGSDDDANIVYANPTPSYTSLVADCGNDDGDADVEEQVAAHIAAFNPAVALALLAEVEALRAELARRQPAPPDKRYKCGCQVVWSDKIKAFCPTHHEPIPSAATDPTGGPDR